MRGRRQLAGVCASTHRREPAVTRYVGFDCPPLNCATSTGPSVGPRVASPGRERPRVERALRRNRAGRVPGTGRSSAGLCAAARAAPSAAAAEQPGATIVHASAARTVGHATLDQRRHDRRAPLPGNHERTVLHPAVCVRVDVPGARVPVIVIGSPRTSARTACSTGAGRPSTPVSTPSAAYPRRRGRSADDLASACARAAAAPARWSRLRGGVRCRWSSSREVEATLPAGTV